MKAANGQPPRPRADVRLYLFHGPDEAGAADLARRLVASMGEAERLDLDGAALKKEPGRLADEAASVSLFGGARVIRAAPIGEESLEALTLLLDADQAGAPVIAVAPGVRASGKIVRLALDHDRALSIACYAPTGAEADRLVATMLSEQGLRPGPGVARQLAEAGGGDRAVIACEVEKLALYLDAAPDRPRDASADDLAAIGADLGEAELSAAVAALVGGDAGALGAALAQLDAAGGSAIPWLRALQRRLIALAEMRADVDRGEGLERVMKANRVHFREEAATAKALRRWTPLMLTEALARLRAAERAGMAANNAGAVIAERAAVRLAQRLERRV